jgi:hypothetical protein
LKYLPKGDICLCAIAVSLLYNFFGSLSTVIIDRFVEILL